jgi:sugar transferase (PEP-CTERM system associated)
VIKIFNHYLHRRTLMGISFDVGLLLFALLSVIMAQVDTLGQVMPLAGTHVVTLAAAVFVINAASGLYQKVESRSLSEYCARATLALLLSLPVAYVVLSFLPSGMLNREAIQLSAMLGISAVILRRVYVSHWTQASNAGSRILIYGSGAAARLVGQTLRASDPLTQIVGYLRGPNEKESVIAQSELVDGEASLYETARRLNVDEIVVALAERRAGSMPLRELLDCKVRGIRVFDLTTHFERTLGQIRVDFVNAGWLVFGDGFSQGFSRAAVKRIFDIVCALILIVLAAPVMVVTALAIVLESRGSVLYRQERVGANNKSFQVAKFRSMYSDAEKDGKPRWATTNDSRITRVGQVIRKLRIDELPQLFNVLRGEMSLVGPRPERPFFVEQLTQEIPYYAVRHSVKPGVTGWAQVRYEYGSTVEDSQEKLQYDLYYVKNHTLFLDMVILLETVGVVLTGKGAR